MLSTKTNVIEPNFHSNQRTELRLDPNRVYRGSLRIGNLGCTITGGALDYYNYNTTAGVLSLIKNIYIYDGGQLLDQLIDAHHMFGFRSLQNRDGRMNKNAFNYNINQQLIALTNSYNVEKDSNDLNVRPKKVQMIDNEYFAFASSDPATTFAGWVDLSAHFNFLKNMVYNVEGQPQNYIDTNVFKNLRVIIEYRPANELVSCFQGNTAGLTADITRPQLFCDEVYGLDLPRLSPFAYDVYELDKVVGVPANANVPAITKVRVNGFNGKYVKKLLLMNIDPTQFTNVDVGNTNGIKCDGSQVYTNEVLQLYVNGETLFDFNGIDSDSRRLFMLADAWGTLNIPLGSNLSTPTDMSSMLDKATNDLRGKMSYTGALIQQQVNELLIEHKRTMGGNSPQFMIYVWAEVVKNLAVQPDGSYIVSYA